MVFEIPDLLLSHKFKLSWGRWEVNLSCPHRKCWGGFPTFYKQRDKGEPKKMFAVRQFFFLILFFFLTISLFKKMQGDFPKPMRAAEVLIRARIWSLEGGQEQALVPGP